MEQPEKTIAITDKAIVALKKKGERIRLGIKGSGGCKGYSYLILPNGEPKDTDTILTYDDLIIMIDPKSMKLLDGTVLDYEVSLMHQQFVFKNPNSTKSCGCKKSFSIA
jgi:iron-sulfur cluster assembly protein